MGGSTRKRAEIRHDIDSYISRRRKGKSIFDRLSEHKAPPTPQPAPNSRKFTFGTVEKKKLNLLPSPSAPMFHGRSTPPISDDITSLWEGFKHNVKDTIRRDLSRNIDTGGTPMKPSQEFIDIDDESLTVVPIPDEPETASTPILPPKPTRATLQGQGATPEISEPPSHYPRSMEFQPSEQKSEQKSEKRSEQKSGGFFTRWFTKKQAGKHEELLDEDFLLTATASQPVIQESGKELKEDFKELAKLCLKNLERMNKDQLGQYRSTPEFERLKELLRKHHVIK